MRSLGAKDVPDVNKEGRHGGYFWLKHNRLQQPKTRRPQRLVVAWGREDSIERRVWALVS